MAMAMATEPAARRALERVNFQPHLFRDVGGARTETIVGGHRRPERRLIRVGAKLCRAARVNVGRSCHQVGYWTCRAVMPTYRMKFSLHRDAVDFGFEEGRIDRKSTRPNSRH